MLSDLRHKDLANSTQTAVLFRILQKTLTIDKEGKVSQPQACNFSTSYLESNRCTIPIAFPGKRCTKLEKDKKALLKTCAFLNPHYNTLSTNVDCCYSLFERASKDHNGQPWKNPRIRAKDLQKSHKRPLQLKHEAFLKIAQDHLDFPQHF